MVLERSLREQLANNLARPLLPAIECIPRWAASHTQLLYCLIEALWVLGGRDHTDVVERNVWEKTLAPDFRYTPTHTLRRHASVR